MSRSSTTQHAIPEKLMSALVDSTMLYGVKIWGCMRSSVGGKSEVCAVLIQSIDK